MYLSKNRNQSLRPNVYVGGRLIKNVDHFKYLGVSVDPTLSFKKHIKKMCHVLKYNTANFCLIRNSLTTEAAKIYLNAMILSYIQYCVTCWSQANKTVLNPSRPLYGQAPKVPDWKPHQYYHCSILSKYNMLSLDNLMTFSDIRLAHKIINNASQTITAFPIT